MGITNGPPGREITECAPTTPANRNNALRFGSVIAQLDNDQFNDLECTPDSARAAADPANAACGRGWNAAVRHVLAALRSGRSFSTDTYSTTIGDDISRGYARGYNAGLRHALDLLRIERGLAELAHAPVIRPLDLGLKNALVGASS